MNRELRLKFIIMLHLPSFALIWIISSSIRVLNIFFLVQNSTLNIVHRFIFLTGVDFIPFIFFILVRFGIPIFVVYCTLDFLMQPATDSENVSRSVSPRATMPSLGLKKAMYFFKESSLFTFYNIQFINLSFSNPNQNWNYNNFAIWEVL